MDTYEYLDDLFEQYPVRGKMSTAKDPEINNRMATLKRHEDKLNRYRKLGII